MSSRRLLLVIGWIVVLLAAGADLAWHWPGLPERLATHFNAAGHADGWSSRATFVKMWFVMIAGSGLLFAGLWALMMFLPARWINMPNRDYWLAPGRERYTRGLIGELILWLGIVMLATMSALNHLIMRANTSGSPDLGWWPWLITGGNLLAIGSLLAAFLVRFRKPAG